uniref:Uncharacterized protein n=1 Tax=Rhizophora mucronata TaxID=61149 RepID=A0A2P2JEL2_RHIMU
MENQAQTLPSYESMAIRGVQNVRRSTSRRIWGRREDEAEPDQAIKVESLQWIEKSQSTNSWFGPAEISRPYVSVELTYLQSDLLIVAFPL